MNLSKLRNNLKGLNSFEFEKDFFRYVKNEIPHILLKYNLIALFVDSEDTEGNPLGYYKHNNKNPSKVAGSPYTMFESGGFEKGMRIDIKYRKIIITSTVSYLSDIKSNPNFTSIDFFGIRDEDYLDFLNKWAKPYLKQWIATRITK